MGYNGTHRYYGVIADGDAIRNACVGTNPVNRACVYFDPKSLPLGPPG